MRLHDAGGLHAGPQHVLLRGDVLTLGYPLQVVQVAATGSRGVRALAYRCHTTSTLFTGAGRQATNVYRVNYSFTTFGELGQGGTRRFFIHRSYFLDYKVNLITGTFSCKQCGFVAVSD